MSNLPVEAALSQMEAWLADPAWDPDPEVLEAWNTGFLAALAEAEKGEEWPRLAARGHAASRALEDRIARLALERDRVKGELAIQDRGNRALKGYEATNR